MAKTIVSKAWPQTQSVNGRRYSDSTPLVLACAALNSGDSADFLTAAQSAYSEADLSWQTAWYHDEIKGVVHLMGKPANAPLAWKHQYYTIATNTWTVVSSAMWDNVGHIYGNTAMDYTTGDLFQLRAAVNGTDNPRRARWWKASTNTWNVAPVTQDMYGSAMADIPNGCAWHPNLYGANDGGLIWGQEDRTFFWRKSNDAIESVPHTLNKYGSKEGAAVYWPAQNAVFVGGADTGSQLLKVTPNATAGATPVLTDIAAPPIPTGGHDAVNQGAGFGSLHVLPSNPSKICILETAASRMWTSTDGASWTQVGNHPFATVIPHVICSLRNSLGVFWSIGLSGTSTHQSKLWRPPA